MDGRNNQFNPQDTQNRQLINVPPELSHIIQSGVTPEQFAENARRLEDYRRMNAMGLQVYLQRQSQQAEQRRQEEFRLVQLAQQLASGSQQQQLQSQPQPPAPPPPHHRHLLLAQQALASRNAPVIQPYNQVNTNNSWVYVDPARPPNLQRQQHHPPVNASAPFVAQSVFPPRETNLGSHSIGGIRGAASSTPHAAQYAQPPKVVPNFVHQTPQYRRYSGVTPSSSQTNTGHSGAPGGTTNQGVHNPSGNLDELYANWVRAYGDVKAASMAKEYMQAWKQATQVPPTATVPVRSTVAPPAVSVSAQNLQHPSQVQIRKPEGAAPPPPHPPTHEWSSFSPVASSTHGRQASSQHPDAPLSHPSFLQTSTDEINTHRSVPSTEVAYNSAGVQSRQLESAADSPVVRSTGPAPTHSAPPSSQPGSTQSILLASEEKGTALYTMRGLAASIKRSLNAERLAASMEAPASSVSHGQERKRSSSIEVIDEPKPDLVVDEQEPEPKAEPEPVAEPPSSVLPASFSEPQQEETVHIENEFQIPGAQHDSSRKFVPFSTLTGAVSFDNITDSVPVSQNPAPSPEATGVLEDLTTSRSTAQPEVLDNHIEDSFIPVSHSSFDPLSFPHRTPTPPLAATITTIHDEGEADEKAVLISSSHPSTLLHEMEIDSQPRSNPSGNDDDVEMSVAPSEDHVQTQLNIASSELSQVRDNDTPMQEADVSLDPSIEIDRTSIESPIVEDSEVERTSPARATEELARVPPRMSPIRVQSIDLAETSGPSSLPKLPRKSRRKQEFYIAVPPASEWVLRAKHREAERKALISEKAGQHNNKEYTESELANRLCLRHCHWSRCQAVLNSMYTLKQHVRQHQLEVEPVGPAMTVSCQWKQCRMVCNQSSLVLHLNRHIDKGVACAHDDCGERFTRIKDLAKHEKSEHAYDEPPPSAIPRPPEFRSPVALPQTVPSYATTTRPACKPSITAERHARLGAWTLGRIIGHPTAGSDWANTAVRVRRTTRLTDKALNIVPTPMLLSTGDNGEISPNSEFLRQSAEYDILEERSVASSRKFGELDTVDLTGGFYEGNVRGFTPVTESDSALVEALL